MRISLLVFAMMCSVCLGFAPAPIPRPNRPNPRNVHALMQGTWKIVHLERFGGTKEISKTLKQLQVKGNRWTYFFNRPPQAGVAPSSTYQMKLDVNHQPAQLDLVLPRTPEMNLSGIVHVEKDVMRVLYVLPAHRNAGRPKAFGKVQQGQIMMTYRRISK